MNQREEYQRARNPQPGDLWLGFFSYWYWVEAVEGNTVTYRKGPGGQNVSDLPAHRASPADFADDVRYAHFARNTLTPQEPRHDD